MNTIPFLYTLTPDGFLDIGLEKPVASASPVPPEVREAAGGKSAAVTYFERNVAEEVADVPNVEEKSPSPRERKLNHNHTLREIILQKSHLVLQAYRPEDIIEAPDAGIITVRVGALGKYNLGLFRTLYDGYTTLGDGSLLVMVSEARETLEESGERKYKIFITPRLKSEVGALPADGRKVTNEETLTGVVVSHTASGAALWASFDDNTWAVPMLRSRFRKMEPQMCCRWFPLGFECEFEYLAPTEGRDRGTLLFRNVDPNLAGRVKGWNINNKNGERIVAEKVMMNPAARLPEGILMTSPGYCGIMPLEKAPEPLLRLAADGIFSRRFAIRCTVSVNNRREVVCVYDPPEMPAKGTELRDVTGFAVNSRFWLSTPDGIMGMAVIPEMEAEYALLREKCPWEGFFVSVINEDGTIGLVRSHLSESEKVLKTITPGCMTLMEPGMRIEALEAKIYGGTPESVPAGSPVMVLGYDRMNDRYYVDPAIDRYAVSGGNFPMRLDHLHEIPDTSVVVGRRVQDGKLALVEYGKMFDGMLLRRLMRKYDSEATLVGCPLKNNSSARLEWNGIACLHDYSAVRQTPEGIVAGLWEGAAPDSPVLFGDLPLTRKDLALGEVSAGEENLSARKRIASGKRYQGKVVASDTDSLSVRFCLKDGRVMDVRGREGLRLPFPSLRKRHTQTPFERIFTPGSEWLLEAASHEGAGLRLVSEFEEGTDFFSYVAPLQMLAHSEWVLRSDEGAIAVTYSPDRLPQSGERVLMTSDDEDYSGNVVYMKEAEESLIGRKITLIAENVAEDALICRDAANRLRRRIRVPLDRMSWHPRWKLPENTEGLRLKARITGSQNGLLTADRRMLLDQEALLPGISPVEGEIYQMTVVGTEGEAYILDQNGVRAWLPWDSTALCPIDRLCSEFMRPGDLVEVTLKMTGSAARPIVADRSPLLVPVMESWSKSIMEGIMLPFIVERTGERGIYVECGGGRLFVPAENLGMTAQTPMESRFNPGQIVELLIRPLGNGKITAGWRFGV